MYHIRKVEKFTIHQHSTCAILDPEKFRVVGYKGNSEKEFLNFIADLDLDDVYEDLDETTLNELAGIKEDFEWTEFYNSSWNGEESWFESGEPNSEWTKTGGFEVRESSNE